MPLTLTGPQSSYTRQRFPLYPVHCRSQTAAYFTVPYDDFSLHSCYTVAEFVLGTLKNSREINPGQTVGMHNNNLHRKWLRRMAEWRYSSTVS